MKFTDKFVLVPIDRYNSTSKGDDKIGGSIKDFVGEDEKKLGTNLLKGGGEGVEAKSKKEIASNTSPQIQTKSLQATVDDANAGIRIGNKKPPPKSTGKREGKIDKIGKAKKSTRKFVPPPPPGIPNRLKKSDYKWISIY